MIGSAGFIVVYRLDLGTAINNAQHYTNAIIIAYKYIDYLNNKKCPSQVVRGQ